MKKHLLPIALCILLGGCGSARQGARPVSRIHRDTLYLRQLQYDSISLYRNRYIDRSKDTVYLRETEVEYRYRLLRDTVRLIRHDSIPYEVKVVEVQEVKYIPGWCKVLAWIGGISLVCMALRK